jgi:hypothetical protein
MIERMCFCAPLMPSCMLLSELCRESGRGILLCSSDSLVRCCMAKAVLSRRNSTEARDGWRSSILAMMNVSREFSFINVLPPSRSKFWNKNPKPLLISNSLLLRQREKQRRRSDSNCKIWTVCLEQEASTTLAVPAIPPVADAAHTAGWYINDLM